MMRGACQCVHTPRRFPGARRNALGCRALTIRPAFAPLNRAGLFPPGQFLEPGRGREIHRHEFGDRAERAILDAPRLDQAARDELGETAPPIPIAEAIAEPGRRYPALVPLGDPGEDAPAGLRAGRLIPGPLL